MGGSRSRGGPRWLLSAGAFCALWTACGGEPEPAPPAPALLRVVSLSPAASELLLALGAGSQLVAVDAESARLPGLDALPTARLDGAAAFRPHLVLLPALPPDGSPALAGLRAAGSEVIEVAPKDYSEVFALCRALGARLAGETRAASFEIQLSRELAALASLSRGSPRPRVAAVLGPEPLAVAPAHSFATDLIEMAGGTSLSHVHDPERAPATVAQLAAASPDLVLVMSAASLPEAARTAARRAIGDALAVEFFELDASRFWVRGGPDAVRRLRALIGPWTR